MEAFKAFERYIALLSEGLGHADRHAGPEGREIARRGAALLVIGEDTSTQFPEELKKFRQRQGVRMKLNLLVNYCR